MADQLNLKTLWSKQQVSKPDIEDLFKRIDHFKKKRLKVLVKANVSLIFTALFIGLIWACFQPQMLTTKIGICLVILGIAAYLIIYNNMLPLLWKTTYDMNSRQYLKQLIKLKEKQLFLQSTVMAIYYGLLTIGLVLYMIEYTLRMQLIWAIIAYVVVFIWVGFCWFYIMPKKIKSRK